MRISCVVACALACAGAAVGDVVTDWNAVLLDAIKSGGVNPPRASRAMAMVHTAVFDAVNATHKQYAPYAINVPNAGGMNREAAAAAAAHAVLSGLLPAQQAKFDAALASSLAGIPNGPGKTKGLAIGASVGGQMLALRANDNSDLVVPYTPGVNPGEWRPTLPGFAPALLPNWPMVTPFAMTSGSQFRQAGPAALTSADYTKAFNEVKELGSKTSATRTQEQTEIALMWAAGGGTVTPPGQWNEIAQQLVKSKNSTLIESARTFAMLGIGLADSAISAWDNKYEYNFWRPIAGIREADTDGNPDTIQDVAWEPLIATPPFPAYTSGHSTFSSAGAVILASLFGDDVEFSVTSAGITREFDSLWVAAEEAGQSRIYGGIHWQFDNQDALTAGKGIAEHVTDNYFVPAPGAAAILGLGGLMLSRRRR